MNRISMDHGLRRKRLTLCTIVALAAGNFFASPLYAQSITGGLRGSAPQGATIEITAPSTGFNTTLTAGSKGEYEIGQLNPGAYVVKISKDGRELGQTEIRVTPNITTTVPKISDSAGASAGAAALSEIKVSASSLLTTTSPIDVTTPELVSNFSAGLVHDLPMSQTSPLGPYALLSGAKTFGGYYQTNGASVAENRIYYNEFDTNYDVTGLSGLTFPQDAVVDTQVITGSGGLGWTSTTGSITSLTLRQGDNDFHGRYTAVFTPGTSSLLRPQGDNQT